MPFLMYSVEFLLLAKVLNASHPQYEMTQNMDESTGFAHLWRGGKVAQSEWMIPRLPQLPSAGEAGPRPP